MPPMGKSLRDRSRQSLGRPGQRGEPVKERGHEVQILAHPRSLREFALPRCPCEHPSRILKYGPGETGEIAGHGDTGNGGAPSVLDPPEELVEAMLSLPALGNDVGRDPLLPLAEPGPARPRSGIHRLKAVNEQTESTVQTVIRSWVAVRIVHQFANMKASEHCTGASKNRPLNSTTWQSLLSDGRCDRPFPSKIEKNGALHRQVLPLLNSDPDAVLGALHVKITRPEGDLVISGR